MSSRLDKLTPLQKRLILAGLLTLGATGAQRVRRDVLWAQREQKVLCRGLEERARRSRRPSVAVNGVFVRRLLKILGICVPSPFCYEAWLIAVQGALLVSRTFITDRISRIEARAGRHLIALNFERFAKGLLAFAGLAIPAAVVNSALRYMQKQIQLAFMRRLSHSLHTAYCSNRAYYSASVLGGSTHADQRLTEDVEKFSYTVAELYSYTFKPLLDVLLFTRSLSATMGYRGQIFLYAYYVASALGLRALSPPLALMTAQETGLTGAFRAAHQRLVGNAEEVAFNDPPGGAAERLILNTHLHRLLRHAQLSAFLRFVQQVFDGYFVKYFASVVALVSYAAPLYFKEPSHRGSAEDLTQDYIRSMRLLQNTSKGVGDLVLVYKRVTGLAGHTSRVAELLEQMQHLSKGEAEWSPRSLYNRNVSSGKLKLSDAGEEEEGVPEPKRLQGDIIRFQDVLLKAPDSTPLVRGLTFDVPPGRNVMIMGPNGSGKSSLFRVLAGLWPLQGGSVTVPPQGRLFYLSQRPYLVAGSLRDQLVYPYPPEEVWELTPPRQRPEMAGRPLTPTLEPTAPAEAAAVANAAGEANATGEEANSVEHDAEAEASEPSAAAKRPGGSSSSAEPQRGDNEVIVAGPSGRHPRGPKEAWAASIGGLSQEELEERLSACLEAVDLEYLLGRGRGWSQVQKWGETLSGGEKQRLAMARLLFHAPTYAVLDECTSAVAADGEAELYQACVKAGITLLSIAHRPALRRFHDVIVHFEGSQAGQGWHLEELGREA